jgi:hypothetical protein
MEACASAHYWARELKKLGHDVRLMPAKDVKAYVKRNKNDAVDAAEQQQITRSMIKYGNLCSEEYALWKLGRIPPGTSTFSNSKRACSSTAVRRRPHSGCLPADAGPFKIGRLTAKSRNLAQRMLRELPGDDAGLRRPIPFCQRLIQHRTANQCSAGYRLTFQYGTRNELSTSSGELLQNTQRLIADRLAGDAGNEKCDRRRGKRGNIDVGGSSRADRARRYRRRARRSAW